MLEITNIKKKLAFNYVLKEFYECGLVLFGWEVKAIKNYNVNITSNYLIFKYNEFYISKVYISGKGFMLDNQDVESRDRKVLLKKKEIRYLYGLYRVKGYSLIISSVYIRKNFLKAELCVCLGKKSYDKKKDLKHKDCNRYSYL